jgi:hypothetical protein
MRLFVLAARFKRPSFASHHEQSHEAIRSERLKLFRQRNATYRLASSTKGERNAGRRIVLMPARKRRAGRATE